MLRRSWLCWPIYAGEHKHLQVWHCQHFSLDFLACPVRALAQQQEAHIEHRVNQLCRLVVSVHQRPGAAVDLTVNNCPAQVILKLS